MSETSFKRSFFSINTGDGAIDTSLDPSASLSSLKISVLSLFLLVNNNKKPGEGDGVGDVGRS